MFKGEPTWSTEKLLDEIKGEAVRGGNEGNLTYMMPAIAALLIKLSSAADQRAKVIERWTKVVVWLTVVLIFLTIAIVYREFTH